MNALGSLEREHELLTGVMNALEKWADGLLRTTKADREDLGKFMQILSDLADIAHHEKEEDILLPLLYQHGLAWDAGPLRHVRDDHKQERYLTRVIEQAATQDGEWSDEDRRHLLASIEAYIAFQRKHMQREDEALYPVAENLSEDIQKELGRKLAEFDERFGQERYADLISSAQTLIDKYGGNTPLDPSLVAHP